VGSVSFSVLINGRPYGRFNAERGLRQGDPLSPYLFILCSDVLSSLLDHAQQEKRIQGIRISNGGPAITHLLFADDLLFFLKANQENSQELLKIFKEYGDASGQMINLEKSSITFGNRVYEYMCDYVKQTLNIPNTGGGGKYLGLPEQFGRKKKEMLQYIQEKVKHKISGWQNRFLSAAGKETLIKAVAYAMPIYSMNCFQLPKEICSEINSMIAQFWWGSTPDKRKLSWVSWKKMSRSKKNGGLGFRDLHKFNQALLANQVWKLIQRPQSLLFRLLKARYFRDGSILNATKGTQPSYGWNSLRFGRELLQSGLQLVIRDGKDAKIGLDPWLPTTPPRPPLVLPAVNPEAKVQLLMDEMTRQWDTSKIYSMIDPIDHHLVKRSIFPEVIIVTIISGTTLVMVSIL